MDKVKQVGKEIEAKLGDHPNASGDSEVNPSSGVQNVNSGHDAGKSDVQNRIELGQGAEHDKETIRAGSTTSPDAVSAATASGAVR